MLALEFRDRDTNIDTNIKKNEGIKIQTKIMGER
jgi:hypothetical protein